MSDYPDTPITREEQYLAAGLDGGDLPDPITREEQYLYEIATNMQGGGSSVTVEPLTVTQNGTTTAPSGKAYSPVTTNVPNTYTAGDEGKVVSSGALVAQTAHAAVTPTTSNQTVDTTTNNSITVTGDVNLVAGNIKDGVTMFNVTGTYTGGGGNPNSVTVYETTFGGVPTLIDWQELENNNITAYLTERNAGTGADYKAALYINYDADVNSNNLFAANALQIGSGYPFFLYIEWARTTKIMLVARLVSGEDGSVPFDYQSSTPCTLTIIHHPLPSNG